MKNNFIFLLSSFFVALSMYSHAALFQYIYPVAVVDESHLLVLRQLAIDDVELWIWDIKSGNAYKELTSLYLPSSIQMLPSKKAYSFIDRGRIKIKSFEKRTPRALEFCEPIYALCCINWLTDNQFYFVAKYKGFFRIFLCDIIEQSAILSALHSFDRLLNFTYPCKISEELFYITNDNNEYRIEKSGWNTEKELTKFRVNDKQETVFKSTNQLCFLFMQDNKRGFVLELIDQTEEAVSFACLQIAKSETSDWNVHQLFNFKLPKDLIFGFDQARLYESIYPFLPQYFNNFILFTNYDQYAGGCQIFLFDQSVKKAFQVTPHTTFNKQEPVLHYFAPLINQNNIFYGSSNYHEPHDNSLFSMDPRTGACQISLPVLDKSSFFS